MPRRMSVRPTASHTRTPLGTGIIGAATPRSPPQPGRADRCGNAYPRSAGDLDLDPGVAERLASARRVDGAGPEGSAARRAVIEGMAAAVVTDPCHDHLGEPARRVPTPAASGRSGSDRRPPAAQPPIPPHPARTPNRRSTASRRPEPTPPLRAGEDMNLRHSHRLLHRCKHRRLHRCKDRPHHHVRRKTALGGRLLICRRQSSPYSVDAGGVRTRMNSIADPPSPRQPSSRR